MTAKKKIDIVEDIFPIRIRITDRVERNGYKFNDVRIIKSAEDLPVMTAFKVTEIGVTLDNVLTADEIEF